MSTIRDASFLQAWLTFLRQLAMARSYPMPYGLDAAGPAVRNPFLEHLLPSMLFVRLLSLLDQALLIYLDQEGLTVPRAYKNRRALKGRLEFLRDHGVLQDYVALDDLRDRRNGLAHDAAKHCDWNDLHAAVDAVERELQPLRFVAKRPQYEPYAERSAAQDSNDPDAVCEWHYRFGLREAGSHVLAVTWAPNYFVISSAGQRNATTRRLARLGIGHVAASISSTTDSIGSARTMCDSGNHVLCTPKT